MGVYMLMVYGTLVLGFGFWVCGGQHDDFVGIAYAEIVFENNHRNE